MNGLGKYPKIFRGLMKNWKCFKDQSWSIPNFRKKLGNEMFSLGFNPESGDPVLIKLQEFIERFIDKSSESEISDKDQLFTRPYIFDPCFDLDIESLRGDYHVPDIFQSADKLNRLPEKYKPDYKWLLIGGVGSGSPLHIDPNYTSAWNAVVNGEKLWVVIKPRKGIISSHYIQEMISDVVYSHFLSGDRRDDHLLGNANTHNCVSILNDRLHSFLNLSLGDPRFKEALSDNDINVFVQHPGEILYIPGGWYHAALNLTPSVAVTHNFLEEQNCNYFMDLYQKESGAFSKQFSPEEWKCIKKYITGDVL
jgi:histone arginine demethylase JMJD6